MERKKKIREMVLSQDEFGDAGREVNGLGTKLQV